MGSQDKNITPEQTGQTIGYLAGFDGFDEWNRKEEAWLRKSMKRCWL